MKFSNEIVNKKQIQANLSTKLIISRLLIFCFRQLMFPLKTFFLDTAI